ncbi:MAG: DUF3368 domain-containing protein [Anaerolineales bacterium]|nr:DUF3368 domain-containing protein [Anaerolineales bacterium]
MSRPEIVANSSPFIALERVGYQHLLPALFEQINIPPAVQNEVFKEQPLPDWVKVVHLTQPLAPRMTSARLGPGEREAIALAMELEAEELILDDLPARRLAIFLGLNVIGILGLLLRAKKRGIIPQVQPLMDALYTQEFHISERLYSGILEAAGEG